MKSIKYCLNITFFGTISKKKTLKRSDLVITDNINVK